MRKKSKKGFTLVELVVTMVILGILAGITVPLYRNYIRRGRAQEGFMLLGSVSSALDAYWTEHGTFTGASGNGNTDLGNLNIDARGNTYFTSYTLETLTETRYTVSTEAEPGTDAEGISLTMTGGTDTRAEISVDFDD